MRSSLALLLATMMPVVWAVTTAEQMAKYRKMVAANNAANLNILKGANPATGNPPNKVGGDPQAAFIQKILGGQATHTDFLDQAFNSEGYKALLQPENVEVLQKLLQSIPMAKAVPALKVALDGMDKGTITPQEVVDAYREGFSSLLSATRAVVDRVSDPDTMADILEEMSSSSSSSDHDLSGAFEQAAQGDEAAVKSISQEFNKRAFPGLDASVLEDMADFSQIQEMMQSLWAQEEVMGQIDQDPVMSDAIRNLKDFPSLVRDQGYMASTTTTSR